MRPYLVVFGGNNGQENLNDTWILNLEREYFSWVKLNFDDAPISRLYHTGEICPYGNANGMLVIFGGRSNE
jgi:protein phosphatase